jgi:UDP-3-O-[3-hydroxymyristoyl] glucosamine N-acyltransferase
VTWDGVVRLRARTLDALAALHGGAIIGDGSSAITSLAPVERAASGDMAPLLAGRFLRAAHEAAGRGAWLLVDGSLARGVASAERLWIHDHAAWVFAHLLDGAVVPDDEPVMGDGCSVAPSAVLGPRVVLGARVDIGAGVVIGHPGFGWARGPGGAIRAVPQLGGVVIDDDVAVGPLSTIDAGTLTPTRVRRGAKLDAHVHVGHNTDIGEGTLVAAQCGFAGSVTIGAGVLVGGQVGIADHVVVGQGARIAAKSGVIGDVPAGAVVAGYPAVSRMRWLRALAQLYRASRAG